MYKPFHLIGLELNISILSAALRGQPTGCANAFNADVVSIASKDLATGDRLDGEGGYTVWGKALPATISVALSALPIGLSGDITIRKPVARGEVVTLEDVEADAAAQAWQVRRKMVQEFTNS